MIIITITTTTKQTKVSFNKKREWVRVTATLRVEHRTAHRGFMNREEKEKKSKKRKKKKAKRERKKKRDI